MASALGASRLVPRRDRPPPAADQRAETDLQRFRWIAEHSGDVVYQTDDHARCLWVSPSVEATLGWAPGDLLGRAMVELVHPDDLAAADRRRREAIDTDGQGHLELRYRTASGAWRWMAVAGHAVRDSDGRVYGITALRDVDDAVSTRHALEDSERRYRDLADNSVDLVMRLDEALTVVWASRSVSRVLGWPSEQVLGDTLERLLHPDDVASALAIQTVADGRSHDAEVRVRDARGHWVWMSLKGHRAPCSDGDPGYLIAMRDITDTVVARRAVQRSEQRFRRLLARAPIGSAVCAMSGRYLEVNDALCALSGRSREDLLASCWQDTRTSADQRAEEALLEAALRDGSDHYTVRSTIVRPDGSTALADVSVTILRGEDGCPTELIRQVVDVTAMVTALQALESSRQQYRLMAENAADVVGVASADGTIEWISESVRAATGYLPTELVGRPFLSLLHPHDLAMARTVLPAVDAGTPTTLRARLLLADGTSKWFAFHVKVLLGEDGMPAQRIAGWHDIHEEVLNGQALAASEERYRTLASSLRDVVITYDSRGHWTWISPSIRTVLGWDPEDLLQRSPDLLHPDDVPAAVAVVSELVSTGGQDHRVHRARLRTADGRYRWFDTNVSVQVDQAGQLTAVYGISRDVDEVVRAQAEVDRARRRFTQMFRQHDAVMLLIEAEGGVIVDANEAAADFYGYWVEQLRGMPLTTIEVSAGAQAPDHQPAIPGPDEPVLSRHRLSDGTVRHVQVHSSPIETEDGVLRFAVIRDVTDTLRTRQALQASEERFRLAMANAPVATLIVDLDGHIVQSNDAATQMLGYDSDELSVLLLDDLQIHDEGHISVQDLRTLHEPLGATLSREQQFHTRDGDPRWAQVSISLIRGEALTPSHYIVQLLDLTTIRAAREELAYRALHDPLTGLANRAMFDDQLQHALARSRRHGSTIAVLFCDLDAFKQINDRHGHDAGDTVLKTVAARLAAAVRHQDVVARLGGDEFVVLAEDITFPDDGTALAERITEAVRTPISLPDGTITPATSIGIAYSLGGHDHGNIVRRADAALYRAKAAGKNQWFLDESPPAGDGRPGTPHSSSVERMPKPGRIRQADAEERP